MTDSDRSDREDDHRSMVTIAVTFHPQEWVDSSSDDHEWDRRQLIPARDCDPVTYQIPREDATDSDGSLINDESYEATMLQTHADAPTWVADWAGPYYITIDGN